jgi:hypothetical protein
MIEERLKMQPADKLASDMLAAVTSAFWRHHRRLDTRRLDRKLRALQHCSSAINHQAASSML